MPPRIDTKHPQAGCGPRPGWAGKATYLGSMTKQNKETVSHNHEDTGAWLVCHTNHTPTATLICAPTRFHNNTHEHTSITQTPSPSLRPARQPLGCGDSGRSGIQPQGCGDSGRSGIHTGHESTPGSYPRWANLPSRLLWAKPL